MKLAIVDDHKLVRDGLKLILESLGDHKVEFEASNFQETVGFLSTFSELDIVIVDIGLPDKSGIELIHFIDTNYPSIKTIAVSIFDTNIYVNRALDAGAWGYVSKLTSSESILAAIESVGKEESYLCHNVLKDLHKSKSANANLKLLSSREVEILKLFAKGLNAKQVSQQLNIMPKTAHAHKSNIMQKLNLDSNYEILRFALSSNAMTFEELLKDQ